MSRLVECWAGEPEQNRASGDHNHNLSKAVGTLVQAKGQQVAAVEETPRCFVASPGAALTASVGSVPGHPLTREEPGRRGSRAAQTEEGTLTQ